MPRRRPPQWRNRLNRVFQNKPRPAEEGVAALKPFRDGLAHPRLYKVDVDGILAGKCRNIPLQSGDIIYVPKDDISEYNVFVRKLIPTAQLISLLTSRISTVSN